MSNTNQFLVGMAVALSVLAVFTASPVRAQGRGSCAQAAIPWTTTLPDGSKQEAGAMRLCLNRMYNPSSGLHEIQIDGSPIGLFLSRVRESEGRYSEDPVLIFTRSADGEHALIGYAWPDGDVMQTYLLHESGRQPVEIALNGELPVSDETTSRILVSAEPR